MWFLGVEMKQNLIGDDRNRGLFATMALLSTLTRQAVLIFVAISIFLIVEGSSGGFLGIGWCRSRRVLAVAFVDALILECAHDHVI